MRKLHESYGDLKYEKGFKNGVLVGMAYVVLLLLIVTIFTNPCHAQDKKDTTILGLKVTPSEKWGLSFSQITEHSFHDENGRKIAYRKKDSLPEVLDWGKFFELLEKEPAHKPAVDTLIGSFVIVPVTLMCRIQGRPWAFFHDGWEVRKVDSITRRKDTGTYLVYATETIPTYSHLLYLDSRKQPIRKEWVIYQHFKRQ